MGVVVMVDQICEAGSPDMQLDRASQKSRMDLKQLAKKGDVKSARILARELVRANKQRDRLISSQARVKSVQMQLQHQLCTLAFFAC
jgi:charged multivesicular body protein 3